MEEGLLESFVEIVQKMMDRDYIKVSCSVDSPFQCQSSELPSFVCFCLFVCFTQTFADW